MISLFVRLNFGMKIAKTTPLGWLSGTKLLLKGVLGVSKEVLRKPKMVMVEFDVCREGAGR